MAEQMSSAVYGSIKIYPSQHCSGVDISRHLNVKINDTSLPYLLVVSHHLGL